ncbi:MAG TPA: ATP-binding protein [Thermomicrobiales bacterium]|nr:ATP-binding protein [Thermomicrobiales bacterium]
MEAGRTSRLLSRLDPARFEASGERATLIAVGMTLLALAGTVIVDIWVIDPRLAGFYVAVAIAAWYGGWRGGLLAAVLSGLVSSWAFLDPKYTLALKLPSSLVSIVAMLLVGLVMSALSEASRQAIRRAEAAEQRVRILADASALLVSSLDYERTLAHVTELAVPQFADWCTVNIVEEDGSIARVALTHRDPAGAAALAEIQRRYPVQPDSQHPLALAIRSGEPGLYPVITEHSQHAWTENDEHRRLVLQLGTTSVLVVPMQARGRALGAVIYARTGGPAYTEDDLRTAGVLTRRAALAIDNARLFRTAQAAEARYRSLFEGSQDAIIVIGADRQYLAISPAIEKLLGYTPQEMLQMRAGDLLHRRDLWLANAQPLLEQEGTWRGEVELRHKDGHLVPIESRMSRIELPDGPVTFSVWRDISERRAVERLQQEFIVMVTHDLKTPLTSIKGLAQLMLRRQAFSGPSLETIVGQSNHLERLINDLLDVARMEAGRLDLQLAPVDLGQLAQLAADQAQATTSRHQIRVEIAEQPMIHDWDGDRVRQVLLNLLTNATKYSPAGGEVVIRVEDDPRRQQATVSVTDNGVGIAPDVLPRLFSRFYRAEASLTAGEGLGLGLYISRSLVVAHGGRIWVDSTPGIGSTFTFTLPYSPS